MIVDVLALFPEIITGYLAQSIPARLLQRGIAEVHCHNMRDFSSPPHFSCDDSPYGGGVGMVLKPEPIIQAIEACPPAPVIVMSPSGKRMSQSLAKTLSSYPRMILLAGHYEGIDQRVIDFFHADELSIGDYVISSGEVAILVVLDAVLRLLEGAINQDSLSEESFSQDNLLEYPQYTRPATFRNLSVPSVLRSGNHEEILRWRRTQQVKKTKIRRPDLYQELLKQRET